MNNEVKMKQLEEAKEKGEKLIQNGKKFTILEVTGQEVVLKRKTTYFSRYLSTLIQPLQFVK